jgi:hypothetical protein
MLTIEDGKPLHIGEDVRRCRDRMEVLEGP